MTTTRHTAEPWGNWEGLFPSGRTMLTTRAQAAPCPFCGNQPTIREYQDDNGRHRYIHRDIGCCVYMDLGILQPPLAGLDAWNKRFYPTTDEPWHVVDDIEIHSERYHVATVESDAPHGEDAANAARIVACVNACAGIEMPAEALDLARRAIRQLLAAHAALMPGIRHIAVDDYALQNVARIDGAKALRALGG